MTNRKYIDKPCEICGKTITTRQDKPSKTCSYNCMGVLRKQKANLYRVYKNCGNNFIAKKQSNVFCSNKCSSHYRNRDKKRTILCNQCGKEFERPNCHIGERNFCSKECALKYTVDNGLMAEANHTNWKGGKSTQDGYIFKRIGKGKYVGEHRLIMEKEIGRVLRDDEIIHHVDRNKLNNRIDNLQILSRAEHIEIHRDSLYKRKEESK